MALKTYSRQRKHSQPVYEPPSKRRRILSPDTPSFSSDAPKHDNTPVQSSPPLQPQSHHDVPELALASSTPPSSPPAPVQPSPSPILLKRRPAFSFLARRTTKTSSRAASNKKPAAAISPLQPRSINNAASRQTKPSTTSSFTTKKQTRLTQLQLDLGTLPVQKTCSTCGMAYVPSNSEDAALHKAFHAQNVGGVELGRGFVRGLAAAQRVWEGHDGDCVIVVSRRDGAAAKKRVERVMEVVRAELGAVEIGEEELWGQVEVEAAKAPASASTIAKEARRRKSAGVNEAGEGRDADSDVVAGSKSTMPSGSANSPKTSLPANSSPPAMASVDHYKAYLYIQGTKCIGLCLAERISSAYRHCDVNGTSSTPISTSSKANPKLNPPSLSLSDTNPSTAAQGAPLSSSSSSQTHPANLTATETSPTPSPQPTSLGISRIWTSSAHRRSGIGSTLLSAAAQSFLYGSRVERAAVAFSQPTESGARLAGRWVGGSERVRRGQGAQGEGDGQEAFLVYW